MHIVNQWEKLSLKKEIPLMPFMIMIFFLITVKIMKDIFIFD